MFIVITITKLIIIKSNNYKKNENYKNNKNTKKLKYMKLFGIDKVESYLDI